MRAFPGQPEKILIRSTNWIGDAVMTTPAIRTIAENYPDAEITLLALPWVSDVFRACPHIDHIFLYEKEGRHKGIHGKLTLATDLKKEKFDAVILLQNAFEAALITTLARIPVRGGYTTDGRDLLLTHGVNKGPGIDDRHQVHYYQQMLVGLGLTPGSNQLELFIDPESAGTADTLLNMYFSKHGKAPVIGFNPGAAYGPAKRWPIDKFAALARLLCAQTNALILVFGTEADNQAARNIQQAAGNPDRIMDLTGKTDLTTAIACIDRCNAFVTNDSGLMHVAAALNTPTAAIFGSTDHIATGPFSDKAVIIRKSMPCSPCKKPHCPQKHFECMERISAEEVCSSVLNLLKKHYAQE